MQIFLFRGIYGSILSQSQPGIGQEHARPGRNQHGGQSRGYELDVLKLPRPKLGRGDDAKNWAKEIRYCICTLLIFTLATWEKKFSRTGVGRPLAR